VAERDDVVLITGASTGLGLALARLLLAETDHFLILTARPSSMARFAAEGLAEGERVWLRPLDVVDPAQRRAVVAEAEDRLGGIDVLVNNAGVSFRAVVEHVTDEERLAQMDVNFLGPMAMAGLCLRGMRWRRRGRILNVSSVGGMMAMPTMAVYSASKFALEGATESLWYEVRPWNIRVSLIQPGFINSASFENTRYTAASRRSSDDPTRSYHLHYVNMAGFIARIMRRTRATPEHVARTILRTIRAADPPLRVPATFDAHLFSLLRRLLPRGLYHALLYRMLPSIGTWGPILARRNPGDAQAELKGTRPISLDDLRALEREDAARRGGRPPEDGARGR
jgi:NAD(P)-dependent dehydrogenase (short-subunit alcohol dehydrogenase family)